MNCNCCNLENTSRCSEGDGKIKIYGQLVNQTLDTTLDDANCQADNQSYDTGHNDAIAYAYQIHDGRFRADDEDLPAHERFQDAINRRVTDITYDPTGGGVEDSPITIIENPYTHDDDGNLVPIGGDCDCDPYDDLWLKDIIGATPTNTRANDLKAVDLDGNGQADNIGDIINFILNLATKLKALQQTVNDHITNHPSGGGECLWEQVSGSNAIVPKKINNSDPEVHGAGFYDTTVQ